jgi:class 3 adenylate cyclase/tetratricopeptide (TPR) repeat protein
MTFDEILDQAIALLQRRGRVTYRTLKRQFQLDDAALDDLTVELIKGQRLAVDEDGEVLVWTGGPVSATPPAAVPVQAQERTPLAYTPRHLADKILTSRAALEGERKQVTVLFADVAGFTTLAEQLDPEVVHDIINRCFERITAEVHRFEGTINQYTGDGVMALFGAPIAYEDSPRRAVHAALGIQHAIRDVSQALQHERGLSLQMRLGIHTGLVVVGKIGDDLRMDYTAVGDTTNLAARLQQLAQPGSVVISAATQRHVSGFFATRDLGEVPVKGHAPVRAYQVLHPYSRRTRFDMAVERGLTPLVGRERELATLGERFREVKAGRGQVVGLTGDAGVGKSRLLLEFRRALAQAGDEVTWLAGHCISFGQTSPFLPLIEQLRENFYLDEFDGESEIIAKVEQGMRRLGELEAHLPAIRYLLGVDPGGPAFGALESTTRRQQLFLALRALALRGAQRRPLILVVEDLHWTDTSSEEFLTTLLDAVASVPLLLLLTYRSGYTPPFGNRSFYSTLTLRSLSETLTLAGHVLGTVQVPAELQSALMQKAEGVPLFIEEVIKTLLDLGALQREPGGYRLVKNLSEVGVPDTMQGIIMARLDRLGEDAKHLVQLASVIGRQFLVRLLARVAGVTEQLDGLLHELQTLEIIYAQGLVPEPAYIFKHAVIQDVAYNSLLVQRRKALHQAVGEAIEALYHDRLEEHYEELAHHCTHGEVWEKALYYARQAGAKAVSRSAYQEAVAWYERALVALQHLPQRREMLEQAIDLRFDLRNVLLVLGEFERLFEHLCAAETLAQTLGDQRRLGQVSAYMAAYLHSTGAYDQAITAYQRTIATATALGESALQVPLTIMQGITYAVLGDYPRARDCFRSNVAFLVGERRQERFGLAGFPAVFSSNHLGLCLMELGAFAEGRVHIAEAMRMAEAVTQPFSLAVACHGAGVLALRQGDLPAALPLLERGLGLCQSGSVSSFFPPLPMALGVAYALGGRIIEALPLLAQALRVSALRWPRSVSVSPLLWTAELCLLVSPLEEATMAACRALEHAHAHNEQGHKAHALRLLGDIAVSGDPPGIEPAETHYRQALALAEALGMRPLQAHCHRGLGTLYATTGHLVQARAALATAIEFYRDMAMTFWIPQTEAVLAHVEGH